MTHKHLVDRSCIELGHGVCIAPAALEDNPEAGYWIGYSVKGQEFRSTGRVQVDERLGGPLWSRTGSLAGGDLTLSPSIQLQGASSLHGYVRNMRWVPA